MHPLHFGTVWGPWVKALWAMLGLSLAVLTVTGLLMDWNRYLCKRWHVRHDLMQVCRHTRLPTTLAR